MEGGEGWLQAGGPGWSAAQGDWLLQSQCGQRFLPGTSRCGVHAYSKRLDVLHGFPCSRQCGEGQSQGFNRYPISTVAF